MNHWSLFRRSWSYFWRNPALWLFGLLAALSSGPSFYNPGLGDLRRVNPLVIENRGLINQLLISSGLLNSIPFVVGIGIVWAIFAFLLATFAQGALISMVGSIEPGHKAAVGTGFRAGGRCFLPLLAVRFLLALPILIIGLIGAATVAPSISDLLNSSNQPFLNFGQYGAAPGLSAIGFVIVLLMMGIGVSAERAMVLDKMSIGQSLAEGWKMLWSKLRDYLVIAVIFIAVGIVTGLVFICALLPVYFWSLSTHLSQLLSSRQNPQLFMTALLGPVVVVMLPLGLLLSIWATVFVSSVWTLVYRRWRGAEPQLATPALQPAMPVETLAPIEPPKPGDAGSTPASNEPPLKT